MGIETERHLAFHCSLGPDVLLIKNLSGTETLGECFEYVLTLYSEDASIKAEDLLGQHASVRVKVGSQPERFFDGIVCEFGPTGYARRYCLYRLVLRPWFWLLSRSRECRIFQECTTLDIFKKIAKEKWGFTQLDVHLLYSLQEREYCVQYRESDLDFLMRLMQDDGIYFYFKHELGSHTMVLADAVSAHDPAPGFEKVEYRRVERVDPQKPVGSMVSWNTCSRVQPGRVAFLDYDFKKPKADLNALSDDPKQHEHSDGEVFDWPGQYVEPSIGQDRARLRLEALQSGYEVSDGSTDATGLFAGSLFTLAEHPRDADNREYLVTAVNYNADSGSFESGHSAPRFAARVTAISSAVPYRPMRVTPLPVIPGAQTATVVGPKGNEIWTEAYGRVKVQFHWDRLGESDERSSCWVRVAQGWAGANWGSVFIPRIGQEVVVEFLDGNPDKPLITGSVYNEINKPPYSLPDNQTQSGIKTRSSKGGQAADYNELMFEDKKGSEKINLHAQRDLSISVEHDETNTVNNHLRVAVEEGNYGTTVAKGYMRTEVPKNRYELSAVEVDEMADKTITLTVGACSILIDQQQVKLTAFGSTVTLNAQGVSIAFGEGVSTLDVNPMGISATGPMVKLNG